MKSLWDDSPSTCAVSVRNMSDYRGSRCFDCFFTGPWTEQENENHKISTVYWLTSLILIIWFSLECTLSSQILQTLLSGPFWAAPLQRLVIKILHQGLTDDIWGRRECQLFVLNPYIFPPVDLQTQRKRLLVTSLPLWSPGSCCSRHV